MVHHPCINHGTVAEPLARTHRLSWNRHTSHESSHHAPSLDQMSLTTHRLILSLVHLLLTAHRQGMTVDLSHGWHGKHPMLVAVAVGRLNQVIQVCYCIDSVILCISMSVTSDRSICCLQTPVAITTVENGRFLLRQSPAMLTKARTAVPMALVMWHECDHMPASRHQAPPVHTPRPVRLLWLHRCQKSDQGWSHRICCCNEVS